MAENTLIQPIGYKEIYLLIEQIEAGNPVLNILKNGTSSELSAERNGMGDYYIFSDPPCFFGDKSIPAMLGLNSSAMAIPLIDPSGLGKGNYTYYRSNDARFQVLSFDNTEAASDSMFDGSQLIKIIIFD